MCLLHHLIGAAEQRQRDEAERLQDLEVDGRIWSAARTANRRADLLPIDEHAELLAQELQGLIFLGGGQPGFSAGAGKTPAYLWCELV